MDREKLTRRLLKALRKGRLIEIARDGMEPARITGFVTALGDAHVLLSPLDRGFEPDGYVALRLKDLTSARLLEPERSAAARVVSTRGTKAPATPPVVLCEEGGPCDSLARLGGVVTVYMDRRDPGFAYHGRIVGTGPQIVHLRRLDGAARWGETETLRAKWLTRIEFQGATQRALALVAGEPPAEDGE